MNNVGYVFHAPRNTSFKWVPFTCKIYDWCVYYTNFVAYETQVSCFIKGNIHLNNFQETIEEFKQTFCKDYSIFTNGYIFLFSIRTGKLDRRLETMEAMVNK